jgi:hypothetical protein
MSHFTTFIAMDDPGECINLELWAETYIWYGMVPFCESTEDPAYLEFEDKSEELVNDYNTDTIDCVRLPNGSVVSCYSRQISGFVIENGQIYQKKAGPLKHRKKTKKSRKMKAWPNYPVRKLYKSLAAYAEDYCGYTYDEAQEAYGYYHNPNAFWDWYQIGGRWPFTFLVKSDCTSAIHGERSWASEDSVRTAPEGYKWVCGARKSDIEWDLMKSIQIESATEQFSVLEQWFRSGVRPEGVDIWGDITDEGIRFWQSLLYIKDETLEQYLERHELGPECKYPVSPYSFIENGEYISQGDMGWFGISSNDKPEDDWRKMTQDYLDRITDEQILVTVDCHI